MRNQNTVKDFDKGDWDYLSGGQVFPNGNQPMVLEAGEQMIVGDYTGVQVLVSNGSYYKLEIDQPEKAYVQGIMELIVGNVAAGNWRTLRGMGFRDGS